MKQLVLSSKNLDQKQKKQKNKSRLLWPAEKVVLRKIWKIAYKRNENTVMITKHYAITHKAPRVVLIHGL